MKNFMMFILFFSFTSVFSSEKNPNNTLIIDKDNSARNSENLEYKQFEKQLFRKIYTMMDKVDSDLLNEGLELRFALSSMMDDPEVLKVLEKHPVVNKYLEYISGKGQFTQPFRKYIAETSQRSYLTTHVLKQLQQEGYRVSGVRDHNMWADGSYVYIYEGKIYYEHFPEGKYDFICHPTKNLCAKVFEAKKDLSSEVWMEHFVPNDWDYFLAYMVQ